MLRRVELRTPRAQLPGRICLVRAPARWWFTCWTVLFTCVFVAFLMTATYKKRVPATGVVAPKGGVIRLLSPSRGTISAVHVSEGQHVKKNDLLFIVTDDRRTPEYGGHESYRAIRKGLQGDRKKSLDEGRTARVSIAGIDADALKRRLKIVQMELSENSRQQSVESGRVVLAKEELRRHVELAERGHISSAIVNSKRDEVAAREAQLLALKREKLSLERVRSEAVSEREKRSLSLMLDLAIDERDGIALAQEEKGTDSRESYSVVAPTDGRVAAISVNEGASVTDVPLAQIIPDTRELVVYLYVTSRAMGFVEAGQVVRLRVQAFPYQHYGQLAARIIEISESPMQPSDITGFTALTNEPLYRIAVELPRQFVRSQSGTHGIKAGMVVDADIELESRTLIRWILEPLYGMKNRFS